MLADRTPGLTEATGFTQGLVPIPKPMPIPAPTPLPGPNPIQNPAPLPRPSVLPGTATVDQYYLPRQPVQRPILSRLPSLTEEGLPAVGQYLAPSAQTQGAADAAAAEATRRALTAPASPPATAAMSQISLPGPRRFWRGTAANRQVTIPSPEDYWRGMPVTSQIYLPTPEEFWRR